MNDIQKLVAAMNTAQAQQIAIVLAGGTSAKILPQDVAETFIINGGTIVTLDTSGELKDYPTSNYIPLLSGNQGGGGDRGGLYNKQEYQANVSRHAPEWQKIRETKHIIFVSSMTGATGSTSIPTFLKSVMAVSSEYQMFFVGTWSKESEMALANTRATIDSIEGVRRINSQVPIGMFLWETTQDYDEINEKMLWTVLMLIKMLSLPSFDRADISTKMKLPRSKEGKLMTLILEANVDATKPLEVCEGRLIVTEKGTKVPTGTAQHSKAIQVNSELLGGYANMVLSTKEFPITELVAMIDQAMARLKSSLTAPTKETYNSSTMKVGELTFI